MHNLEHPKTPFESAISGSLRAQGLPGFDDVLLKKIKIRLAYEQQLKALRPKLWATAAAMALSLSFFVASIVFSWHSLMQSPAWNFLSLMFTDFKAVAINWQDFLASVLENFPLGASALVLGAVLICAVAGDFFAGFWTKFTQLKRLEH